ncbi:DUF255 domain-containing protein [Nesterenkonia sp.]|uniref:thioredoxin domain-containing protein n=1 Tax=Nesterenkonia sp. TaxID=704201 RepID=UPI00261B1D08|nr:DUF255 domain-containing protein [Nesterenkonia sp.]
MGNELSDAQSQYLRQHAENPVHWRRWSSEAFAEAARRDVPVFVSIGYAACHWCHVMAHESFEDETVAAVLNEHFVCIKVDREEHPEVDDAYMAATQAMTGQGGWPMSVFTTPAGRVFHAGTYFPPQRMGRIPSFREVCQAVWEAWTQRREQVEDQAQQIAQALGEQRRRQGQLATVVHTDDDGGGWTLDAQAYTAISRDALAALVEQEDPVHGGFGAAPKFPPSPLLGWLLEEAAWVPERDEPQAQDHDRAGGLALHTMEAMARSALFDQVEGGFARYATDRAWSLPHFEKMLYDNAQLLGSYARASAHPAADERQRHDAECTARQTIGWLRARMLTEEGLLASSLDADTVDEEGNHAEGATYLFSDEQLRKVAADAGLSAEQADQLITLNSGVPADEHALRSGEPLHITEHTPRTLHFDQPLDDQQRQLWEAVLPQLLSIRAQRRQSSRDAKVVAAWNAKAVESAALASSIWEDPEVLDFAEQIAARLWEIHAHQESSGEAEPRVWIARTSYAGTSSGKPGTLADHAHTASACFALASAGAGSHRWEERGLSVLRWILAELVHREPPGETGDTESVRVLDAADDDQALSAAQDGASDASPVDGPEPSSIAALAQALQRAEALGHTLGVRAADLLHHLPTIAPRAPLAAGGSLLAAHRIVRGSPAVRVLAAAPADLPPLRRQAALLGIPVEPVAQDAVAEGRALQVSICLNEAGQARCLAPSSSLPAALRALS